MKITDDMLSRRPLKRANCCKPACAWMRCPSTVSPENSGVKCRLVHVHKALCSV